MRLYPNIHTFYRSVVRDGECDQSVSIHNATGWQQHCIHQHVLTISGQE